MTELPGNNKPSNPTQEYEGTALRHLPSHVRLWLVAALGLGVDLWSKHWAFTQVDPHEGQVIIPHLVRFQRSLNTGALFGLGKGWTPLFIGASVLALFFVLYLFRHSAPRRWSLHIALGLVLAGALGNLHDRAFEIADVLTWRDPQTKQVIPLVGLITDRNDRYWEISHYPDGPMWRRIPVSDQVEHRQQGVVRDFIRMEPSIPWGDRRIDIYPWVFNIADAWLVIGVAVLLLNFWIDRRAEKHALQKVSQTRS